MAAPAVSEVVRKYRTMAYAMVGAAYLGLILWFLFRAQGIWASRADPPTVTQVSYGSGISGEKWGNTPFVMFVVSRKAAEFSNASVLDGYQHTFNSFNTTFDAQSPYSGVPVSKYLANCEPKISVLPAEFSFAGTSVALADFTTMKPNFSEAGVAGAIIEVKLSLNVSARDVDDPISLMVFSALPPNEGGKNITEALLHIRSKLTEIPSSSKNSLRFHFQTEVPPAKKSSKYNLHIFGMSVTKSTVPNPGDCWGYPGESPCIHTHFDMHQETSYSIMERALKEDLNESATLDSGVRNVHFRVKVATQTVTRVSPTSMVRALVELLGVLGGYFSLVSTFFYVLFVHSHPHQDAPADRELTLLTCEMVSSMCKKVPGRMLLGAEEARVDNTRAEEPLLRVVSSEDRP